MEDEQATNLENVLKFVQEKTGRSAPINFKNEQTGTFRGANETVVLLGDFEFVKCKKSFKILIDFYLESSYQRSKTC